MQFDQQIARTARCIKGACCLLWMGVAFALLSGVHASIIFAADASVAKATLKDMEALAASIDNVLSEVSGLIKSNEPTEASAVMDLVDATFQCESLRPGNVQQSYRSDQLSVARATNSSDPNSELQGRKFKGYEGAALALNELKVPLANSKRTGIKFKIVQVAVKDDHVDCQVIVHLTAVHAGHVLEQSADWSVIWSLKDADSPRILNISVDDFEEVRTHAGHGQWFSDCTESVFDSADSFGSQLMKSTRDWRSTLTSGVDVDFIGHIGLAVGDVNGDDLEDIFVCQGNGLPNRLYVQQPDGTVKDVSAASGVDWLDTTRSALLIDLDNDGDQDLVCGIQKHLLVLENDGKGKFQLRSTPPAPQRTYSICAADYDSDGDLDIYACGYTRHENFLANPLISMLSIPTPYHDARNGGPNTLLRNDGDFVFADATEETGLDGNNDRFSHAAVWEDFDNDGDQDLYVANDFGRNNFYRNENGQFTDIAAENGTEDMAAGMGLAVSDFDKDGWMDIYVSNMFSAAGNRATSHEAFKARSNEQVKSQFRRHARGNTLLRNTADGVFSDVSQTAGVTLGRWAWSSNFVDMNNDGWQDLFVGNGYITNEDTRDL